MAANKFDSLRGRVSFPLKGYEYVAPTRRGVPLIRLVGKGPTRISWICKKGTQFSSFSPIFGLILALCFISGLLCSIFGLLCSIFGWLCSIPGSLCSISDVRFPLPLDLFSHSAGSLPFNMCVKMGQMQPRSPYLAHFHFKFTAGLIQRGYLGVTLSKNPNYSRSQENSPCGVCFRATFSHHLNQGIKRADSDTECANRDRNALIATDFCLQMLKI